MTDNPEPIITINGVTLTEGEAMTVRVMLTNAASELENPSADDALGPIANAYRARLRDILALLVPR